MSVFNPLTSDYACRVLSEVGEKLCLKPDIADVHFVFNSNDESCERVPAHKLILMAASDVFGTMFNGTWKEKDEVEIVDVSADSFKEFLKFFYLGRVKLTMENVGAVMKLGDKYDVAGCVAVCSNFLKNNLNDDNVCWCYGLAILFNQLDLKQSCETVIGLNTNAVLKSTDFLSCDKTILTSILKLDSLSCTEVELFEACMLWVKATSEKDDLTNELVQSRLGDSLHVIRFSLMLLQEFLALVPKYGQVFTGAEYNDIIQMITNKEFQAIVFNGNREKRCFSKRRNEEDLIKCDRVLSKYFSTKPHFLKELETTKFSVNEPILLMNFFISCIYEYRNGKHSGCECFASIITIVECSMSGTEDSKKEVVKYSGERKLANSISCLNIVLPKPILIIPGLMYEIRLKQSPPENCVQGSLLKSKVQMEDGLIIQFHNDPLIPSDIAATGLIYCLNFNRVGK